MYISDKTITKLKQLLGAQHVHTDELTCMLNSYDCSPSRHRPDIVLTLTAAEQIAPLLTLLAKAHIPFITRAAATNHAGSCSAVKGGAVLNINALHGIEQINTTQGFAVVAPATITAHLQKHLQPLGFFYAPDPASEQVSTLGGNLAQNASGARCLKYGNTADNTLEIKFVTPDGHTHLLRHDNPGPDWLGIIAGSEGTLGIVQQMKVKILPTPKQIKTYLVTFPSLDDCVQTVTDLVGKGLIPRCVEAMDKLTVQTIENFSQAGYPQAEALLIIELDSPAKQIKNDEQILQKLCHQNHCQTFLFARQETQRQQIWSGRRAAYSAMAALAPNVAVGDGTVPRSELPRTLQKVRQAITQNEVTASLLFHAGDGNFHPQLVFDARQPEQTRRVQKTLQEILKICVDAGGTISGEHGIGVEKRAVMAYQYSRETLRLFQCIKRAFDPLALANPEKIIPVGFEEKARCAAIKHPAVRALQEQIKNRFLLHQSTCILGLNSHQYPAKTNILSAAALDQLIEIDKTNYTATIQAGASVKQVIRALQAQEVYAQLPADYPGSIGGLVATKSCPEFSLQLTGIEAILPNGDFVQYGGKLMKNAAGYNLCRLFAGSWGTFGLITQITCKIYAVEPSPAKTTVSSFPADALFQAVKNEIDPQHLFISAAQEGISL